MLITEKLVSLQDPKYGDFQSKLVPNIQRAEIIGVRMPKLRQLAQKIAGSQEATDFLKSLPHDYYDENILHGILISSMKDYSAAIAELNTFLPYVNNWAACDTISPKVFQKNRVDLLDNIKKWVVSEHVYTCRIGVGMLMRHFLDEDFKPEYHEIPAHIHSDEYYINMMIAWYFATALAKQWESTIPYLERHKLNTQVHNKTIQKARESFRITADQKAYLKTLKR